MKIRWNSSMCNRGNIVMVKGGEYETNDFKDKVSKHTLEAWIEDGAATDLTKETAPVKEAPKPEPEPEPVKPDVEEHAKIKELKKDEAPAYKPKALDSEAGKFACPKDCERHTDPYKSAYHFVNHMKKVHKEIWKDNGTVVEFKKKA